MPLLTLYRHLMTIRQRQEMTKKAFTFIVSVVLIASLGVSSLVSMKPMACASKKSSSSCCPAQTQANDDCTSVSSAYPAPAISSPKKCCCPTFSAVDQRLDETLPDTRSKSESIRPVFAAVLPPADFLIKSAVELPPSSHCPRSSQERVALLQVFLI